MRPRSRCGVSPLRIGRESARVVVQLFDKKAGSFPRFSVNGIFYQQGENFSLYRFNSLHNLLRFGNGIRCIDDSTDDSLIAKKERELKR